MTRKSSTAALAIFVLMAASFASSQSNVEPTYVDPRLGFEISFPATYHIADASCNFARGAAYHGNWVLQVRQRGTEDAYIYLYVAREPFSMGALRSYAPTGVESNPQEVKIGGEVFYYYGPGGGGVGYPDQYFYNLDGRILVISFDGPYANDKTPAQSTKLIEKTTLATFRRIRAQH